MKIWVRRSVWAALGVIIVLGLIVLDFLRHGGQFNELPPPSTQACTALPLELSAEDIQPDRSRGVAYLSALDRRGLVEGRPVQGDILQLDVTTEPFVIRRVLAGVRADFRPHGMSLYRMGDGNLRLFVISHPPQKPHEIVLFEQTAEGFFVPIETWSDPLLRAPNAIVAVGPRSAYVANDKGSNSLLGRVREVLWRTGLSTVVLHDDAGMRVVAEGLQSASGIALSPDGTRLFVAETVGKRIAVYARDLGTNALTLIERIEVPGAPDNVQVDPSGALWVAVHPRTLDLIRHFADADHPAPTLILRIAPGADGRRRIDSVLADRGARISAGSVGTPLDGRLLVGSITDRKILVCRLGDTP